MKIFFFKLGKKVGYVRLFQKIHADTMIETARVLLFDMNAYGIPHVRFLVSFRRHNRIQFDGGARTLGWSNSPNSTASGFPPSTPALSARTFSEIHRNQARGDNGRAVSYFTRLSAKLDLMLATPGMRVRWFLRNRSYEATSATATRSR